MSDHDVVSTSGTYLRAVLELEEEGVAALRARLVERFTRSVPTVSQNVARLRRDGLVDLDGDRRLVLSEAGRTTAAGIVRKHRLTEVFLDQVVGIEWPWLHVEARGWEHVMSDRAEDRLDRLLDHPRRSPYGNPIPPARARFDDGERAPAGQSLLQHATRSQGRARTTVGWIGELLQDDPPTLQQLVRHGLTPGAAITIVGREASIVARLEGGTSEVELSPRVAEHIFTATTPAGPSELVPPDEEAPASVITTGHHDYRIYQAG